MLDKLKELWRTKLVRNTGWMLLGHGSRVGLQALYFVLAARFLGAEGLGVFSGALAVAKILLPLAGWGSDEVLARRVSRNHDEYPEALGNALLIIFVSGSVFSLAAVGVNQVLFAGRVSWVLMLLIASAELILYRLQMLVRRAYQAYDELNVTAIFKAAPSLTLTLAIVGFYFSDGDRDVDTWAAWYFAAMALPGLAAIVMLLRRGRPVFSPRLALRQLNEGFFFSLAESSRTAYSDADKILLLRMVSKDVAGVYKAAYRVLSVLMMPVLALLDAAYGRFFKTGARGIRGSFRFAVKLLPISMLYSVLVAVALWFTAPILPLILGKGYANSVEVLRWLAIIPVAQGASYLLMQSLTGGGHQRARAIGQMVLAGVNVVGNAMLIPTYGWKAAASMAVASELILCAVMYGLCRWTLAEVPPEDEADAPPSSTSTGDTRP